MRDIVTSAVVLMEEGGVGLLAVWLKERRGYSAYEVCLPRTPPKELPYNLLINKQLQQE